MSLSDYDFGSPSPDPTRGAENNEPALTVPGSASPEGTYLAPPQEAVSSPPIEDLCTCLPGDPPVFLGQECMYSDGYQNRSYGWPFPNADSNHWWVAGLGTWRTTPVLEVIPCASRLYVVLSQWTFLPCLCADPQRKSVPFPAPSRGIGSSMGTPTVDNGYCLP